MRDITTIERVVTIQQNRSSVKERSHDLGLKFLIGKDWRSRIGDWRLRIGD
jgi:hypothetical protein